MIYDHEAIRKAYPKVTGIVDGGEIKLNDGTYVTTLFPYTTLFRS